MTAAAGSGARAVAAPAKVNLHLKVLSRRADGFHELVTLFQAVDLSDRVTVVAEGSGIELDVLGADLGPVRENLAYRAAEAYRAEVGYEGGVRISLEKRIPAGAGLGGGSSDAAAVLRCLDGLGPSVPPDRLAALGASLGSDVPFFLGSSPLAIGTGRGEVLEPLPPLPPAHLVLALPPVHVSTADAYAALSGARAEAGRPPERSRRPLRADEVRSWEDVVRLAHNDFEPVVSAAHAEVAQSLDALREAGAAFVLLSGSGAASFGRFPTAEAAVGAAQGLSDSLGWPCVPVTTRSSVPSVRPAGAPPRSGRSG